MTRSLAQVLKAIDEINAQDPNLELVDSTKHPKELIYGQRMTEALGSYENPNELLQIACRAQHIKRWAIPRSDFPMDKAGYLKWRTHLKIMHGDITAEIMQNHGYNESDIKYVKDLLMKKDLKKNLDAQILEDVACLVFLKFHIADFAADKEESKLIDIIQKTWAKMSVKGHELALQIHYPAPVLTLIQKALAE
jgi:hypothetical protein